MFSEGEAPDPRFSLANERTFLAWIRTALALVAGGIGVGTFLDDYPKLPRTILAAVLLLTGGVVTVMSYRRWLLTERALRSGQAPPTGSGAVLVTAAIAVLALVLLVLVLFPG